SAASPAGFTRSRCRFRRGQTKETSDENAKFDDGSDGGFDDVHGGGRVRRGRPEIVCGARGVFGRKPGARTGQLLGNERHAALLPPDRSCERAGRREGHGHVPPDDAARPELSDDRPSGGARKLYGEAAKRAGLSVSVEGSAFRRYDAERPGRPARLRG